MNHSEATDFLSAKRATSYAIWLLIAGIAWTFLSRTPADSMAQAGPPPNPREGFSAPDFTLDLLGGGTVTLSDLRGKPVVLNIWATWCPPCRKEMPAIEKVYRSYKDLGLVVIGLNLTSQDSEPAVSAFIQQLDLTFPIALDRDGSVGDRYQLMGLPTTFFIDRQGVIQAVVVGGPMSETLIQSKVEALLQEEQ